jgi:hypothetical protein
MELDRKVSDRDTPVECIECHEQMKRSIANIQPPTVLEKVESYRNVHQRQNNDARVRQRAKKFFIENEMKELIGQHGLEQAKRNGWVKSDGKVVKKDDLK